MKNERIPETVLRALAQAGRAPGWNNRDAAVKQFVLGDCTLYVVPFRRWAYRRTEKQAAAWHAEQAKA